MCGIAGILSFSSPVATLALERMADSIRHRGPDSGGVSNFGSAGLAHRRLSIIDLNSGAQPLVIDDGRLAISFNGEIYNYRELRRELEGLGECFITRSDTEVILRAYRVFGSNCLARLNGMFAFSIWDAEKKIFFCARDPLGIKPFFYAHTRELFAFASEPAALLQLTEVDSSYSEAAIHHYLRFGYVAHHRPIHQGVSALSPGHSLTISTEGLLKTAEYWAFKTTPEIEISEADAIARVREEFQRTVKSHLISDVPVGSFLSGGLDSSAVTAAAAQHGPIETFTVGFASGHSEVAHARRLADQLECPNHSLVCEPEQVFSKVFAQLDEHMCSRWWAFRH